MYHQGELIWSSKRGSEGAGVCATSLQKDGNLVLYKESMTCFGNSQHPVIWAVWDSRTDYHPKKTEMRIQDQQLQVIHTVQDGTQRLFFTGENIREFEEEMGAPRQVAEQFLIKNHNDTNNDSVILKRNEYIGDLNALHLILQTNCELQLKNSNQTIWSFAAYLKPDARCVLSVQGNSIGIPKLPINDYNFRKMNILPPNDFIVLQSDITFQGDQLIITQILENGSEIVFYNEPGQDNGLKLKRELRQIASNNIPISSKLIFERLDYIGNLDDLHLILQDNCILTLANGQEEFWKLQESLGGPFMECFVQFNEDGTIMFNRRKNNDERGNEVQVFGKKWYDKGDPPSQFQLSLETNRMILTLEYQNNTKIYYGGANTNGTWFQLLLENSSFIINANDTENQVFPEMGYIGDIDGVYAVLNKRGNWILSNKSQVIWESGTTKDYESGFVMILTRDGNVALSYTWNVKSEVYMWSTQNLTKTTSLKKTPLSTAELLVNNDGLWLIHTYTDGTGRKFKAQEGTNNFTLVPNKNEVQVSSPSQISKL